ncbi:MAG: hypothetical protein K6T90_08185 [Leptolyngbyaceae cyanobacterium HOT.MB2.61]|jgi:hypothetical protein|nr:hypothetical protein [Leptolyngbyaceae cyanobacterium HOT.MB2.61]
MPKLDRADSVFVKHFYRKSLASPLERFFKRGFTGMMNTRLWKWLIHPIRNSKQLHIGWFGGVHVVSGGKR